MTPDRGFFSELINTVSSILKKYYYDKHPNWCCEVKIKPMFENIGPYEYKKVIENLANNYKKSRSNYYNNLLRDYKNFDQGIQMWLAINY